LFVKGKILIKDLKMSRQIGLTLPSPKERVLIKSEVKVPSFGEDLGEATKSFIKSISSNRRIFRL